MKEADKLRHRVKQLVAALRPFAKVGNMTKGEKFDITFKSYDRTEEYKLTKDDFENAAKAMNEIE